MGNHLDQSKQLRGHRFQYGFSRLLSRLPRIHNLEKSLEFSPPGGDGEAFRRVEVKMDGPRGKWTVHLGESGRSKALKVDGPGSK